MNDRCRRNWTNGRIRISAGSDGLGDFFGFLDRLVDDGLSIAYGLNNDATIDDWSADDRAPASGRQRWRACVGESGRILIARSTDDSSLLSQHCLLFFVLLLSTRQFQARGEISSPLAQIDDKG